MTNGSAHTPPPPPPGDTTYAPGGAPQKKGLSPIAWVGIGCGVLVILGLVIALVVTFWLGSKVKDAADNPEMSAAKMIVRVNPELELVDSDDAAGTLTIRNIETGEVMTVDVSQVREGQLRFRGEDGEEVTMGMEEGEDGEGAFTVRDREGKESFRIGAGGEKDIPAWVPVYRGVALQGTFRSASGGEINGGFSFQTDEPIEDVLAWYREALEEEGFTETGSSTSQAGGGRYDNRTYEADGRTVGVMATGEEGTTQIVVSYSGPEE